jgi:putative glutamine amidotransferase
MRRIGIVGSSTGEGSFGTTKTYLTYIAQSLDAIPVILCPSHTIDRSLELVIMPGGMDVSPTMYGAVPQYYTTHTDVFKQHFADVNLPLYLDANIPVMGICLGHQMICAHFGSALTQHISEHSFDKRGEENHKVKLTPEGKELLQFDRPEIGVNSHHHQAIFKNSLADGLIPLALAPDPFVSKQKEWDDPIIEAFIHESLPAGGVQWHPEEWYDPVAKLLAEKLIIRGANARKASKLKSA